MRIDFIANASHELRTPLASLIGFIETLQGPAADDAPARVRFLAIMSGQAARMRRLIDNLLSLSRIQMQEHERPDGRVVPADLLARIAAEHEPQVAAAGATLAVEVAPDLPPVAGDADQLAQVLQNLLDNALKYGIRLGAPGRLTLSAVPPHPGRDPAAAGVVLRGLRRRSRHRRPAPAAADRALLPRRGGAQDRQRARARHRQAHRRPPWRPAVDRERARPRRLLQRLAARVRRSPPAAPDLILPHGGRGFQATSGTLHTTRNHVCAVIERS